MNLRERRSMQRRGWMGFLALTSLPIAGVTLLSGRLSLFFVAAVAAMLCALFAVGFTLLYTDLRARAKTRQLVPANKLV